VRVQAKGIQRSPPGSPIPGRTRIVVLPLPTVLSFFFKWNWTWYSPALR
jgi:hypothetical protein